MKYSM